MAAGSTVFGFGFRIFAKDNFTVPVNNATQAANNMAKSVKNVGDKSKNSSQSVNQLGAGMSGAATAGTKLVTMFQGLIAATVAYVGIRSLAGVFSSFTHAAREEEDQLLKLTSITGSSEAALKAYEFAVRKAADTPFEIPEIIDAFTQLSAFGIDATKNMDLVGNMAKSMGKSLEESVFAVNLAVQGMSRSLRQSFGVNTAAMQESLKGLVPGTQKYKEVVLDFLGNIKRFQGGMERAKSSIGVISSNIADFWTRMKLALVGKPGQGSFADSWKNLLKGILNWFEKNEAKITAIFQGIGRVLGGIIDGVSRVVQRAFGFIESWVNRTAAAFSDQKKTILPFILFLELAFGKMQNFIEEFLVGWEKGSEGVNFLRKSIAGLFLDMKAPDDSGWGSFAEALGNIAAGFKAIAIAFDLVKQAVKGWEWLFSMGGKMIDQAVMGARAMFDPLARQELRDQQRADLAGFGVGPGGQVGQNFTLPSRPIAGVDTTGPRQSAGTTTTVGDISVIVQTQPGQMVDSTALASEIMRKAKEASMLEDQRSGILSRGQGPRIR